MAGLGSQSMLDPLCVRDMLVSGADEIPRSSPPQKFLVPVAFCQPGISHCQEEVC